MELQFFMEEKIFGAAQLLWVRAGQIFIHSFDLQE